MGNATGWIREEHLLDAAIGNAVVSLPTQKFMPGASRLCDETSRYLGPTDITSITLSDGA